MRSKTRKNYVISIFAIVSIAVPVSLLTTYASDSEAFNRPSPANQKALTKNYQLTEFDLHDASLMCRKEAKTRLGKQLLRTRVDQHSSRFEESRNTFLVLLKGDIGNYRSFDTGNIYCHVAPKERKVAYFAAYNSENTSLFGSMSESFGSN